MLMIAVKDREAYLTLSGEALKTLLTCPCGCCRFILWGTYSRTMLPGDVMFRIQRVRCKGCGCTHGILPSFILGRVRHTAKTIQACCERWIESGYALSRLWAESEVPHDISTLYRWGSRFCQSLFGFDAESTSQAGDP